MNILVLGAGALGGYYGARLLESGADVSFLVRPKRAALLATQGLRVRSPNGDFSGMVNTVLAEDIAHAAHAYDFVLLTCKAYDLDSATASIAPAVGEHTSIVPLLNGLGAYDRLDGQFGKRRILGGVSYIATSLNAHGEVVQLANFDRLSVGARSAEQHDAARAFFTLIDATPGTRSLSEDIEQELWEKWVLIAAGAAITCLMRAPIGTILKARDGASLIKQALAECTAVASAAGHAPRPTVDQTIHSILLDPASTWAASMMRDIDQHVPRIEADAIVGDMLRRAEKTRIDAPLLRIAFSHLQSYEAQQTAN